MRASFNRKNMPRPRAKKTVSLPVQLAENFHRSRRAHAFETAQDYMEAIADLTTDQGEARVTDLAPRFGVTAARCGDARNPPPRPQSKSPAAGYLRFFRQSPRVQGLV
jgi:hypothetical protein